MEAASSTASNGLGIDTTMSQTSLRSWRWVLIPDGDGYIIASALDQNYVLDVPGGNAGVTTAIQLYEKNGTDAQRWKLVPVD